MPVIILHFSNVLQQCEISDHLLWKGLALQSLQHKICLAQYQLKIFKCWICLHSHCCFYIYTGPKKIELWHPGPKTAQLLHTWANLTKLNCCNPVLPALWSKNNQAKSNHREPDLSELWQKCNSLLWGPSISRKVWCSKGNRSICSFSHRRVVEQELTVQRGHSHSPLGISGNGGFRQWMW